MVARLTRNSGSLAKGFCAAVRNHRERLGRSHEQFAHQVGLHPTYVGAVEHVERGLGLLNAIARPDEIGIFIGDLFGPDTH